jgi:hypothetical protein
LTPRRTFRLGRQAHEGATRSPVRVRQYYQDLIACSEFLQLSSAGLPEPTFAADRDRVLVAKNMQCSPPTAQRARYQPQARSLGCSTSVSTTENPRDTERQSVRLTASFLRPERRSVDGQMILKMPDTVSNPGLTC